MGILFKNSTWAGVLRWVEESAFLPLAVALLGMEVKRAQS
jgi:hypothetical protein